MHVVFSLVGFQRRSVSGVGCYRCGGKRVGHSWSGSCHTVWTSKGISVLTSNRSCMCRKQNSYMQYTRPCTCAVQLIKSDTFIPCLTLLILWCFIHLSLQDVESYIHRSGRTGRAGRTGVSILFYKTQQEHVGREKGRSSVSENWSSPASGYHQGRRQGLYQVLVHLCSEVIRIDDPYLLWRPLPLNWLITLFMYLMSTLEACTVH